MSRPRRPSSGVEPSLAAAALSVTVQDHLEQLALVVGRGGGHLLQRVVGAEARRNAEAMHGTREADGVAVALYLAQAD